MERGLLLDLYLLKSGIFRVERGSLAVAKGLSKEDFESATPLRCWQETTAREVGSCWRAQVRSRVLEAEESDMVRQLTTRGCPQLQLLWEDARCEVRVGGQGRGWMRSKVDREKLEPEPPPELSLGITRLLIGWAVTFTAEYNSTTEYVT